MILLDDPNVLSSEDYCCPKCGQWHNDTDDGYDIEGEHWPKYENERKGGTCDGNYHDWDEIHKCEKCGTVFVFENGAY